MCETKETMCNNKLFQNEGVAAPSPKKFKKIGTKPTAPPKSLPKSSHQFNC